MGLAARWPVVTFTVIVLALGGLAFLAGLQREVTPFALVLVIPAAAILSAWLVGGVPMVRGLFERVVRWRVPFRWYGAAIGIPLLGTLAVVAAGVLLGQASVDDVVAGLSASVIVVPLVVFLPALFEEFAWRGFGVDIMLRRGAPLLVAALTIGIVFTAIHLPLYLPGQLYEDLPLWPVFLILMGYAVLLAWIYDGSGRSSLLAGITHAALNGFVPLTAGLDAAWAWQTRGVVFGLIGLAIAGLILVRGTTRTAETIPREDAAAS
jgi:membrane protease YdiL (CAAX protease family)